jgi:hypothetical protein
VPVLYVAEQTRYAVVIVFHVAEKTHFTALIYISQRNPITQHFWALKGYSMAVATKIEAIRVG